MRKWILALAAMTLLAAACAEETPPTDGETRRFLDRIIAAGRM